MYSSSVSQFYRTLLDSIVVPPGVAVLWVSEYGGKIRSGFRLLVCKKDRQCLVPFFLVRVPPPVLPPFSSSLIRLSATKVYASNSTEWIKEAPAIASRVTVFADLIVKGKGKPIENISVVVGDYGYIVRDPYGNRCTAQMFAPPSEESIKRLVAFREDKAEEVSQLLVQVKELEAQLVKEEKHLSALLVPVAKSRSQIASLREKVQRVNKDMAENGRLMKDSRPLFDVLGLS
jgi:hypothetical protein